MTSPKTMLTKTILIPSLLVIFFIATALSGNHHQPALADSFNLGQGKKIFSSHCAGCHGANGEGSFGPNLCDAYWIHGGHYHNIVHVIKQGVPQKGMSAFHHSLKHHDVRDVAHYVLSLKGTKPANAKAAEGRLHK